MYVRVRRMPMLQDGAAQLGQLASDTGSEAWLAGANRLSESRGFKPESFGHTVFTATIAGDIVAVVALFEPFDDSIAAGSKRNVQKILRDLAVISEIGDMSIHSLTRLNDEIHT